MHIKDLNEKAVCILGFGREGQATARALKKFAPDASITVADQNVEIEIEDGDYEIQLGDSWLNDLKSFDVIIKSPGIPPLPELDAVSKKVTNSTQIFLDTISDSGSLVIGITGSKGKSTTASLIYEILKEDGRDAYLVGNIGSPTLDYLDKVRPNTIFVQEMSSFQLMNLTVSPPIAVVTSFFPEHLDYHGTIDKYKEAKTHITKYQGKNDVVFFDALSPQADEIASCGKGKKVPFGAEDAPVDIEKTQLLGTHNLRNIAAAVMVARHLGISDQTILAAIPRFEGLPHRLQHLGVHHGISWVDDAISTTPESAIAAIESLGDHVGSIILGGQDRSAEYSELGNVILNSNIKHVILFPESGKRIRESIETAGASVSFDEALSMEAAVASAKEKTPQGTICLLSTASPSYNMFKNYEDKGGHFERCILE